jgi:hypothetical protein
MTPRKAAQVRFVDLCANWLAFNAIIVFRLSLHLSPTSIDARRAKYRVTPTGNRHAAIKQRHAPTTSRANAFARIDIRYFRINVNH